MLPSDLLAKGWIQGHAVNVAGTRFCIVGAMSRFTTPLLRALTVAITKEIEATEWKCPLHRMTISTWNDQRARTQAEVVALVRRAEIACGLRPEDNPEQWEIPVQIEEELRDPQVEPVLAETV